MRHPGYPSALQWLEILHNLGRAPATLDAYACGLAHYLHACEQVGVEAHAATFEQVTRYIGLLLSGQPQAVANATLQQRLSAIRLSSGAVAGL
ncbi:hypothetical protein [Pseudomonas sp. GL-B-16]|uniref:hypothetical protein n=1 Tax=Pseudomonas sp. GL-B-16 TaxID=2832373 RepID=UPI001CC14512|nr:hypothetical protein [Pseudomonas sp. GL-B-16]